MSKFIQKKGLDRGNDTFEKYYTKKNIVELCLKYFSEHVIIDTNNDLIIEPSAGNGAFIDGIKNLSKNYLFFDIEPDGNEIVKCDLLIFDYKPYKKKYKKIHIIGNPPFGRQSSMALKFIKKVCEFCDTFSFILPKSFKKDSLKSKIPINFHLIYEIDLPSNSFLVDGIEHDVPCIFQIWEKRQINRIVLKKLEPKGFIFVSNNDKPDIAFRRVGVYAGKISKNIVDASPQSHYFIKFNDINNINEIIHKLSAIIFDTDNTVGPKSISKQELIKRYNEIL